MKRTLITLLCLTVTMVLGLQCAAIAEAEKPLVFVYIARDTANAYEFAQASGFIEAIEDYGYTGVIRNAESSAAEDQIIIVEDLIAQGVDGICICCNDANALRPALREAMNAGIITVSTDGAASKDSVIVHIAQCDSEAVGRVMAESILDICGSEGQFAVLSAASTSPEQIEWLKFMDIEMQGDTYKGLVKATTVYGDDESEKSYRQAEGLIKSYPDLKCIVCPTTVGIMATAKAVIDHDLVGKIAVYGLGLPSEMAEYIENGACPYFHLWSPIDTGYLSGRTLVALTTGDLSGEIGSSFSAGRLGDGFTVVMLDDRPQVVLGDPMRFDATNIADWKDVF